MGRLLFLVLALPVLASGTEVKLSGESVSGLPSIQQRFDGFGGTPETVRAACQKWLADIESELREKGLTPFRTACTRNVIIAPPQVQFYGVVYFAK